MRTCCPLSLWRLEIDISLPFQNTGVSEHLPCKLSQVNKDKILCCERGNAVLRIIAEMGEWELQVASPAGLLSFTAESFLGGCDDSYLPCQQGTTQLTNKQLAV